MNIELNKEDALSFLDKNNIKNCQIAKVAGDASFRSYYRIFTDNGSYILMFAPPKYEDLEDFIKIDEFLLKHNLKAPEIFAQDKNFGFLLLEDFGDLSLTKKLRQNKTLNLASNLDLELDLYKKSCDCLLKLQNLPESEISQEKIDYYNNAKLLQEVMLFVDWYLPFKKIEISCQDKSIFKSLFLEVFDELQNEVTKTKKVVLLRDYHADNLMITTNNEIALLDFQDALIGSAAYDVVSLIEDARRDINKENSQKIYDYFISKTQIDELSFKKQYKILSLQRNIKILGIFTRLHIRDKKDNYLSYLPRVENFVKDSLNSQEEFLQDISKFLKQYF